jgi:hypothetical protein
MRSTLAAALGITAVVLLSVPADAQTTGVGTPMVDVAEARDIAAFNGVVLVDKIEFDEGVWKVEGRDRSDRRVEMRIDPVTGEIEEMDRFR